MFDPLYLLQRKAIYVFLFTKFANFTFLLTLLDFPRESLQLQM